MFEFHVSVKCFRESHREARAESSRFQQFKVPAQVPEPVAHSRLWVWFPFSATRKIHPSLDPRAWWEMRLLPPWALQG